MKFSALYCLITLIAVMPGSGQAQVSPTPQPSTERKAGAPFAAEIAAFEASDKKNMPPPGGILFVGSSSIRLWSTLAQDFPGLPVINRGFGGSQIADSVRYADRIVIPYKPKMIVFYAGTNDLNAGKPPAQVLEDYQSFVDKVHATLSDTRIVYLAINPSVARWKQEDKTLETIRLIRQYVREADQKAYKLSFIDAHERLLGADGKPQPDILRADGLHLNAKGYKAWLAIVKPEILELWKAVL